MRMFWSVHQARLDKPDMMRTRRATVEHPFGTIKSWMGSTHLQMKTLPRVSTEMSLHVLTYNMKRAINLGNRENHGDDPRVRSFVSKKVAKSLNIVARDQ